MTDIYYALLQKIRGRDGDLFGPRVRLRAWHKALLALKHLRPRLGPLFKGASPQAVELRGGAR